MANPSWLDEFFTTMKIKLGSTLLAHRSTLKFTGSGVDIEDDPDALETVVTITAGSGTVTSNTPQPIGTASAGTGLGASRDDHVHAHGNQSNGDQHTVATSSLAGFMSAALFTIANNFVTQSKTANFTVSAARFQHFIVNASGACVATMPTSGRVAGDIVRFTIASGTSLSLAASDTSLPAEFSTGLSATLDVVSAVAGNSGQFEVLWDGSKWVVTDHPRARSVRAEHLGYGLNASYRVAPVARWEPKDFQDESERVEKVAAFTTTNATQTTALSRTHSTASRSVFAKMVARGTNTATNEVLEIRRSAAFWKGASGNLVQVNTTSDEGKTPADSTLTWDATITPGATNVIDFKVTGAASTNIRWNCTCETVEDKFS